MNSPSYYTRMFPHLARPPSTPGSTLEKGLAELGKKMKRPEGEKEDTDDKGPLAGFTYLGQFIDHDLTFDITPLARAHPHAKRISNFRSPFLDMDHLYGGGPSLAPFLYEFTCQPGAERFLIGKTSDGEPKDLPRNSSGIALVADPRQDENLIIAQLHVFFLERHNRLVDKLLKKEVQSVGPAGATVFEQARRLSTWWYQHYALNVVVQNLVDIDIFNKIQEQFASRRGGKKGHFRVPIEFSVAAFRFGHSMVRDTYDYNEFHPSTTSKRATLQDLLERTGMGGGTQPSLPGDWVMDLTRFLKMGPTTPSNNAMKIGPHVASALHQLHPHTVKVFNAPCPADQISGDTAAESFENMLPVRNLWRGARMGLPSGQDVAKALSIPPLSSDDVADGPHKDVLTNPLYEFHKDTPLWYYILKEAELRGKGKHLGPVGSWIVVETMLGALWSDPSSYLSVDPSWKRS
jgi:hypothetical protein